MLNCDRDGKLPLTSSIFLMRYREAHVSSYIILFGAYHGFVTAVSIVVVRRKVDVCVSGGSGIMARMMQGSKPVYVYFIYKQEKEQKSYENCATPIVSSCTGMRVCVSTVIMFLFLTSPATFMTTTATAGSNTLLSSSLANHNQLITTNIITHCQVYMHLLVRDPNTQSQLLVAQFLVVCI